MKRADSRDRARWLRRTQTSAEKVLWELMRGRKILGLKFVRQHPIGSFIADFCCREVRLVVELDGGIHLEEQQMAYDRSRDAYLQGNGYTLLRFPNEAVLQTPDAVLYRIAETATHLQTTRDLSVSPFSPSPVPGEGAGG